jgi:hypothetical protein
MDPSSAVDTIVQERRDVLLVLLVLVVIIVDYQGDTLRNHGMDQGILLLHCIHRLEKEGRNDHRAQGEGNGSPLVSVPLLKVFAPRCTSALDLAVASIVEKSNDNMAQEDIFSLS